MSVLLDVKNLRVDLPTENGMLHAVRGIDFQVGRGEMLCLGGESGCGKSMTSLALMGLLPRKAVRSAERLDFDGIPLQTLPERKMEQLRGRARRASLGEAREEGVVPGEALRRCLGANSRVAHRVC